MATLGIARCTILIIALFITIVTVDINCTEVEADTVHLLVPGLGVLPFA